MNTSNWIQRIKALQKNHIFIYGLPFMTVVLLGPFVLRQFNNVRYKYRKVTSGSDEELQEMYSKMKTSNEDITLEKEYEKVKQMDIDNWEQKRGPRPWEESFEEESKK